MSATASSATSASGRREPDDVTKAASNPPAKKPRLHTPGGVTLGKENSREAQRVAAAILEVLAGVRTPGQAAEALAVSLPRYYHLEGRAMRALVESCEARPRGRVRSPERELTALRQQQERLQRELGRQQTLVRLAQRSVGLAPPAAAPAPKGSKKRRRRPTVRALAVATHLQQQSQEAARATAAPQAEEAGA
jgi:hypothetical protein